MSAIQALEIPTYSVDIALQQLLQLAARLSDTSLAYMSLIDDDRQQFIAQLGMPATNIQLSRSICADVIQQAEPLVVPDVLTNARFKDSIFVSGPPYIRFYAGVPLVNRAGIAFGTLCVLSDEPRPDGMRAQDLLTLSSLAQQAMALLELRGANETHYRTYAELRAAVAGLQAAAEANPQVPWTADAKGTIAGLNRRWLEITGQTPEQSFGLGWAKVPHPEDLPFMKQAWEHSIATGDDYDIEHRIRLTSGRYRWMRSRAVPYRSATGEILGWFGTTEDIQDRKVAEAAVAERDKRLRLAVDATKLGTWDWDLIEGTLTWDARTRQLFGVEGDRPVTVEGDFWAVVHASDLPALRATFASACEASSGGDFEVEFRVMELEDGEPRWVLLTGCCFFAGANAFQMIGTVRDITRIKLATEVARKHEMQLQLAQETAEVGVWEWDLAHDRVVFDAASAKMYGLAPEHSGILTVSEWTTLADAADPEQERADYDRSVTSGALYDKVFEVPRGVPNARWIKSLARPIYGADGAQAKLVGLNVDVTGLKRAEAKVVQIHADFARLARLTTVGALASTLTHELNQPLSALTNYLLGTKRLITRGNEAFPEADDAISNALRQVNRIEAIIKRVRDFTVTGEVRLEKVNLLALMNEAWKYLMIGHVSSIRFRLQIVDDITVNGDSVRLLQVFTNILRNSVQALKDHAEGIITVLACVDSNEFIITMTDNGPGFEPQIINHLFEPFQTTKKSGTGLGLPLCRNLIEMHGGTIEANNGADGGACFVIRLPRDDVHS